MRAARRAGILPPLVGLCLAASGCGKGPVPAEGLIVTSEGQPVWGVAVGFWAKGQERQPFTTLTDPEGHFNLTCPGGEYRVTVVPPNAKGARRGSGVGPLPSGGRREGPSARVQPPVPGPYWRADTTPLRVRVPASGVKDLVLEVQDLSD
jgi:hypothetical protein